ncbi:MAG: hypothetical protein JO131_07765 [Gammaproteobacteria bacterium]|nr:hypothetical protein [Gammaproteobacteria bacterium]
MQPKRLKDIPFKKLSIELKKLLDRLNLSGGLNKFSSRDEKTDLNGGVNKIYFKNTPIKKEECFNQDEKKLNQVSIKQEKYPKTNAENSSEVSIVITKQMTDKKGNPKFDIRTDASISFLRQASQLQEYNSDEKKQNYEIYQPLNSPFIQPILAYGVNSKITEKATADLYRFKEHASYSKNIVDFKEIFAQMLLAMHDLHSRNLVHRDPTPKNFLVNLTQDNYLHVMLSDLDSVIHSNSKNIPLAGPPPNYTAPEINLMFQITPNSLRRKEYNSVDKKTADCFTLGVGFKQLFYKYTADNALIPSELKDLITHLTKENPKARLTIKQAMDHAFFGSNPDARREYFYKITEKFKRPDVYFDGYYQSPSDKFPKQNDYFFLLPDNHKEIFNIGSDLQDSLELISQMEAKGNSESYNGLLISIDKQSRRLFRLTEETTLSSRLIKELKQKAQDIYNSLPLKSKSKTAAFITSKELKNSVLNAFNKYIAINKMENLKRGDRFFEKLYSHGISGKENAEKFKNQIEENFKSDYSPRDIYLEILKYLENGPGNYQKTSFKTILTSELSKVLHFTPGVFLTMPSKNKNPVLNFIR